MWVVLAVLLSGCSLESELVPCGDLLCPGTHVCAGNRCVEEDQVAACVGLATGDPCTTPVIIDGVCADGACLTAGCGNGFVEASEMCDDGNIHLDDGCSADCLSDETCGNEVLDFHEQCEDGGFLSGDGCSSTCRMETLQWTLVDRPGTPRLSDAAMIYDTANQQLLMFGQTPTLPPIWRFNGTRWEAGPVGVTPRSLPALAYDANRQRVVLFGGYSDGYLSDTWEFDGTSWMRMAPATAPPARSAAKLMFDPVRGTNLLFGGIYSRDGDTPRRRWRHHAVRRQRLLLHVRRHLDPALAHTGTVISRRTLSS